jgi:hypothetical protein
MEPRCEETFRLMLPGQGELDEMAEAACNFIERRSVTDATAP